MNIDVRDYEIILDDNKIVFPASYDDIKKLLGEARIESKGDNKSFYIYDSLGITFEDADVLYLKKSKAFVDKDHMISYIAFYIDDADLFDNIAIPQNRFSGRITFFGQEWNYLKRLYGSDKYMFRENGEIRYSHISALIRGDDSCPNYSDGLFMKTLYLSFTPERPKSNENYDLKDPDEECLVFDNFNFKLAVIQELMYRQEVLKPYFDIYDYLKFKKSKAKTETEKNIKAAVDFFKKLQVPLSLAENITKIAMDGGNEIYGNIAPLWDGEDGRFDINEITPNEIRQFPNLRKMEIMTTKLDKLIEFGKKFDIEITDH